MLNDTISLLTYLGTRRSGRPRDMVAPGPSRDELNAILTLAARTPDHGKIVPYRFVIVDDDQRDSLAELFAAAVREIDPEVRATKLEKVCAKAHYAPGLVILISSPARDHKIPVWEQELTAGAVGMNLLHATHAHGYVGAWITGDQAYAPAVISAFCKDGERIAGYFFLGSPGTMLEERERPDMDEIVTRWCPPAV
ncbi:nitroreductase family protein [Sphingomicrobium marinum]|uniref:nitroreductase family protein n=1 Tax=Sphingomicrobium marinum TaxID=1227950 RepID=UPI0022404400|nr:nitroreductase [Sphingomicrobium marinum]